MCGITGTPGTGKSSVAGALAQRGSPVLHLSETISSYIIEVDQERDTRVIDEERWAREFSRFDGFVERPPRPSPPLRPDYYPAVRAGCPYGPVEEKGLSGREGRENALAEALDVILIETLESFSPEQVYELDTTDKSIAECSMIADQFARGQVKASFGAIDWSDYIGQIE